MLIQNDGNLKTHPNPSLKREGLFPLPLGEGWGEGSFADKIQLTLQ